MFNRIRISTTLFLILILCGILQIGSNGMSFWAFRDDLQRLNQVEQSNRHKTFKQRGGLRQTGARRRHQRFNVIRRIAKCRQSARFVQRGTGL